MDKNRYTKYLKKIRWNGTPICPHCGSEHHYAFSDGRRYKCKACRKQYTVTVGTIFESSKLSLKKWFIVIANHGKASQSAIGRTIGITQKSMHLIFRQINKDKAVLSWKDQYPSFFVGLGILEFKPIDSITRNKHRAYSRQYARNHREKIRVIKKRQSDTLPDWAVRRMIKCNDPDLIKIKRLQILLRREVLKNEKTED